MPSLEDVIEEERGYFLRTDSDGDERLSKKEFIKHFLDSMGDFSQVNITDESDKDAAFSFSEFDANADGFVDWSEWSHMMFHEGEQDPEYRDGEEVVPSEFPSADQVAHLQRLFQQGDTDKSGSLSKDEVRASLSVRGGLGCAASPCAGAAPHTCTHWQLGLVSAHLAAVGVSSCVCVSCRAPLRSALCFPLSDTLVVFEGLALRALP